MRPSTNAWYEHGQSLYVLATALGRAINALPDGSPAMASAKSALSDIDALIPRLRERHLAVESTARLGRDGLAFHEREKSSEQPLLPRRSRRGRNAASLPLDAITGDLCRVVRGCRDLIEGDPHTTTLANAALRSTTQLRHAVSEADENGCTP